MSRTATDQYKRRARALEYRQPLEFTVFDLRYPRRQDPAAGKPMPQLVRRRLRCDGLVAVLGRGALAWGATRDERRARAATRTRLVEAARRFNGPDGLAAVDELDVPPYMHRRNALWEAI